MKYKIEQEKLETILTFGLSGIVVVSFYFIVENFQYFKELFFNFLNVLSPFVIGFCLAFLLIPIVKLLEKYVFKNKRGLSVIVGLFIFLGIIALCFALLIPQLYASWTVFVTLLPNYIDKAQQLINEQMISSPIVSEIVDKAFDIGNSALSNVVNDISKYIPSVINYSYAILLGLSNFLLGIMIAVYMLMSKENFTLQTKRFMYAFFPKKVVEKCIEVVQITNIMFNKFIFGKALDSLIIGIICYVVMQFGGFPYPLLISFIIGVTNMIPVFGPFIGAIPCILILLMINPIQSLSFTVFVVILQQIDGNIIGPHIIGDSMGLPNLWIVFAIIIGGGLFGIVGMFVGIPIFAVIYILMGRVIAKRLSKKRMTIE